MASDEPKAKRKRKSRFTDASPDEEDKVRARLSEDENYSGAENNVSSSESEDSEVEKMKKIRKVIEKEAKKQGKKKEKATQDFGDIENEKNSKRRPENQAAAKTDAKPKKKSKKQESSSGSSSSDSGSDSDSSSSGSSSSGSSSSSDDSRRGRKRKSRSKKRNSRSKKRRRRRSSSSSSSSSTSSGESNNSRYKQKLSDDEGGKDSKPKGGTIIDLERETRKLAAKLKSQEAKRNYNKFYIRTAPVEVDLMSNETLEERDARTVFILQIHYKVHARDLHEFFSAVGNVVEVKILTDEFGRKSRCMAYVEFADVESVPLAFGLAGQKILGVPIQVKPCDADRNRVSNTTAWTRGDIGKTSCKLHVGNLHPNLEEKMLRDIFEPFGKIKHIRVERNQEDGRSKGFGTIEFKAFEPSRRAMEALDGYNVGGMKMKVQLSQAGLDKEKEDIDLIDISGGSNTGVRFRPRPQGVGAHAAKQGWDEWVTGGVKKEEVKEEDKQYIDKRGMLIKKTPSARFDVLDKDEVDRGGVLGMSKTEKVALMARLADGTDMVLPKGAQEVLDNAKRIKELEKQKKDKEGDNDENTPCFMLKHMFGLDDEDVINAEHEQDWVDDLEADIIEETFDYGGLVHIHVDRKSIEGIVYLKAPTVYAAKEIIKALHGRYFGGRVLEAAHIPLANYNDLFPASIGKDRLLELD